MATKLTINPFIIPNDRPYVRELFHPWRHTDNSALTEEDLTQYDNKTVFYDLFFDPTNRYLYALGPPLLNLKQILWPITVNGCHLKPAFYQKKRELICCIYAKLPHPPKPLRNEVVITFKDGLVWRTFINANQQKSNAMLTLVTLSKDNRLRWIQDWIYYYRKEFKIERVIFYDNNSDNKTELMQNLDTDVVVIDWDFKFGPYYSHTNKFCKIGALNHCRLHFGTKGYCFSFDIDELFVVADKKQLHRLLKRNHLVRFDNIVIPHQPTPTEDYSFADFTCQQPLTAQHKPCYKYIYRFEGIRFCNVHDAIVKKCSKQNVVLRIMAWLRRQVIALDIRLGKVSEKPESWLGRIIHFCCRILESKQSIDRYYAPHSIGYYLHYRSITTSWKPYWNRLVYPPKKANLDCDTTIRDIFREKYTKR